VSTVDALDVVLRSYLVARSRLIKART